MSLTIIDYLVLTNEDWEDGLVLDDGGDPAEPLDLTGSSFRAHLRPAPGSLLVTLEASTANGRLVIADNPESGTLNWNVPKALMATIEPGEYVYDIVWTKPDLSSDTVAAGTVTVHRGVTR
jgi:hypothetical protein